MSNNNNEKLKKYVFTFNFGKTTKGGFTSSECTIGIETSLDTTDDEAYNYALNELYNRITSDGPLVIYGYDYDEVE